MLMPQSKNVLRCMAKQNKKKKTQKDVIMLYALGLEATLDYLDGSTVITSPLQSGEVFFWLELERYGRRRNPRKPRHLLVLRQRAPHTKPGRGI